MAKNSKKKSRVSAGAPSESDGITSEAGETTVKRIRIAPSPKNRIMLTISVVLFLVWTSYLAYLAFFK